MRKNRSVGRWILAAGVGTLVAIGCATTPVEETIFVQADGGKTDAAKRPDTNKPADTSGPLTDTTVATDTNTEPTDTNPPMDAGLSSGEPFDPAPELAVGATCPTENDVIPRRCGKCGTQQALCTKATDNSLKIGAYGSCRNENTAVNSCLPNAQRLGASCGLCGKTLESCDPGNSCIWSEVSCEGEVSGGCVAGEVRYLALSCTGEQVARQVCGNACIWSTPEACAARGADVLVLPAANVVGTGELKFWGAAAASATAGTCPRTLGTPVNSNYTTIRNPEATPVNVHLWHSKGAGGAAIGTTMGTYAGATVPATDAERMACVGVVADSCGVTGCAGASASFAALERVSNTSVPAITIPAGGDITVYSAAASSTLFDAPFALNVAREAPLPAVSLVGPATVGQTVQGAFVVPASGTGTKTGRLNSGTCPVGVSTTMVNFVLVTVTNPSATPATFDIGADPVGGGDFQVSAYYGTPVGALSGRCVGEASDSCRGSISSDGCVQNIVVPAGGNVVMMVTQWSSSTSAATNFNLKAKRTL